MTQTNESPSSDPIIVRVDPVMKEILPEFLSNARHDVKLLREAIAQSDYEAIARLGHSMKGAFGIGFDHLMEIGVSLEDQAKAQERSEIVRLVDELENYLSRVEPVFESG